MKILVTGGAGFIGSHTVDLLVEKGYEVIVIDNLSSGSKKNVNEGAKFYELDLGEFEKIKEVFENEKPEIVYHFAAQINVRVSVDNPVLDAKINIVNAINLLELCKKNKIKHFIFSSTGGAIYGDVDVPTKEETIANPISPYGCAKLSIEKYLNYYEKVHGLKYTIVRYANVYGPRQNSKGEAGVISIFINNILDNKSVEIWGGKQTRDFVYVKDVALANLLALKDEKSEIYNIGTGIETNIMDLFEMINNQVDENISPDYREKKEGEQEKSCLSYDKINKSLGWKPFIELKEGIKQTYEWFLNKNKKRFETY